MSCKRRRINQQRWTIKKKRSQGRRNWLDLPTDVMLLIFIKLGVVELLANAQKVCSLWKKLAKEPLLYRSIDFQGSERYTTNAENCSKYARFQLAMLAKEAVDRSCGQLVKLSTTRGSCWDRIFCYVNSTNSLKSLKLRGWLFMSEHDLAHVVGGLDSLEELDMDWVYFPDFTIGELSRTCQKLTSFRLRVGMVFGKTSDNALSVMAKNLPQLHRLTLEGFLITNKGLQTILEGFPRLEHLDLQQCSLDKVLHKKNLLMKCATKIKSVIPPSGRVSKDNHLGVVRRVVGS
ncbi:hypothetical protein ACHQM5_019648 [Ranunculus cassubicifolius]